MGLRQFDGAQRPTNPTQLHEPHPTPRTDTPEQPRVLME
jgi:hypothetical protein